MEISKEQICIFSSSILINDIKSYINTHKLEYEEFLKKENTK